MPKRIGYVYDEMLSETFCERAILESVKNKRMPHVQLNYKTYAKDLFETLKNGWVPKGTRHKVINEGTRQKTRELTIPCLEDHFVHTAVAMILRRYLCPKFFFYASGSIPLKGQTFACKSLERVLRKKKPKYCLLADVKKFYPSVKKRVVMKVLSRVFKDKRFLELNSQILDQMGGRLAIGFTVSHWYAQLILAYADRAIKENSKRIYLIRFMDNFVILSSNKRKLRSAFQRMGATLSRFGLTIKKDWQLFPIKSRMIEFLSYRFNHEKTVLRKGLMFKMSAFFRHVSGGLNAHLARIVMSYTGILRHCDSYRFRKSYLYKYVSINLCRRLISNADKKRIL